MIQVTQTDLFSPVQLGSYTLPNRIVMAPMTRNRAGVGNVPTQLNATYYAQRATAGLIVTECTQVSPQGLGYPGTPGIHSPEQIDGWRLVTDAVHSAGGRIFLQLWHTGRISHPSLQPDGALPVAPSAIAPRGNTSTYTGSQPFVTPRALETEEIPGVIEQFRQGAKNALTAGFDGVEIHGAFGYIIDQFLQDGTNKRTDIYGGSIENRVRFLLEVTEAVCSVWGAERVGIKLSPSNTYNDVHDSDPEALFSYAIAALNTFGLGYLHLMEASPADIRHGGKSIPVSDFRPLYTGTLIANGGYDREKGDAAIANGVADLVSFGQLFLANPDLPERLRLNTSFNQPDRNTFYGGDEKGYTDYPFMQSTTIE
ncbi:alkene reductase [Nostoc sp. MS1]|uniref:alkene reductase n=1 Tax=Nostoc sp. MS1 TaxID=2764711 RepID=UPI001CC3BF43|nr:alkene reductase [Nostoc sp. MS1]BCL38717.1 alkene reductase [Nostoc sp. MS1]